MQNGEPTVDLERMDIGRVIELARHAGMVLREYNGDLHMSSPGGPPPQEIQQMIRQNRPRVMRAVKLEQRMEVGWHKTEMEQDPVKKTEKEDYWLELLRQYDVICGERI